MKIKDLQVALNEKLNGKELNSYSYGVSGQIVEAVREILDINKLTHQVFGRCQTVYICYNEVQLFYINYHVKQVKRDTREERVNYGYYKKVFSSFEVGEYYGKEDINEIIKEAIIIKEKDDAYKKEKRNKATEMAKYLMEEFSLDKYEFFKYVEEMRKHSCEIFKEIEKNNQE